MIHMIQRNSLDSMRVYEIPFYLYVVNSDFCIIESDLYVIKRLESYFSVIQCDSVVKRLYP